MTLERTGCSFIDNLIDGDYQHNHSFFRNTVNAFRLEALYLYDLSLIHISRPLPQRFPAPPALWT